MISLKLGQLSLGHSVIPCSATNLAEGDLCWVDHNNVFKLAKVVKTKEEEETISFSVQILPFSHVSGFKLATWLIYSVAAYGFCNIELLVYWVPTNRFKFCYISYHSLI